MLVRRGHTYLAAARVPGFVPLSVVRNKLVEAGFVDVSVRAVEHPNYNAIGQGTWTRPDQNVDLPSQVVFAHDITPQVDPAEPIPGPAPVGPTPGPSPVGPSPVIPSPEPSPHRARRRRAPSPADPSVQVVAVAVAGIGALVLWKLKRDGFWNRRAWR